MDMRLGPNLPSWLVAIGARRHRTQSVLLLVAFSTACTAASTYWRGVRGEIQAEDGRIGVPWAFRAP